MLWKGKYKKGGYKYTGKDNLGSGLGNQNYPTVDVYKGNVATSVKTTRNSNPWSWRDTASKNGITFNRNHLNKIIEGMDQGPNIPGKFGTNPDLQNVLKFELDIYVRDFDTPFSNQVEWQKMIDLYLSDEGYTHLIGKIKVNLAKMENSF